MYQSFYYDLGMNNVNLQDQIFTKQKGDFKNDNECMFY